MHSVKSINLFQYVLTHNSDRAAHPDFYFLEEEQKEIPKPSKAFKKLELFVNSGLPKNFDLDDLNDLEKDEFLGMLYELLRCGVVECESVNINGTHEKHYIINDLGYDWTEGI